MRTVTPRLCLALVLLTAGAAAESATNWFADFLGAGVRQTTVVRHSIDRNRYYLCWTDGTARHGLRFSRANLDRNLRNVAPGGRVPLDSLLATSTTAWTTADSQICWPK